MKKYLTLVPAALLTACTLAGCGSKSVNKLDEFVRNLKAGEVTLESLEDSEKGLFREGIIDAGDESVTHLYTEYYNYGPRWNWKDGLEESEYEEICVFVQSASSFERFDDNKVRIVEDYLKYPYNAAKIGDDPEYPECIDYDNPIEMASETLIWEDNKEINYVYSSLNDDGKADPSSAWSFKSSRESEPKLFNKIGSVAGNSAMLISCMADAEEMMDYYEGAYKEYYPDMSNEKVFKADVNEGKLNVVCSLEIGKETNYEGSHNSPISAENVWGPEFAGLYFIQYHRYYFEFKIENGIITYGDFGYGGVARELYKDKNWKEGDACPSYPLTIAEEAMLDLYMPEKVMWPDSKTGELVERDNPYTGGYAKVVPGGNPFQCEKFEATGEKLGNYKGTLPTLEDYREGDDTDEGSSYLTLKDFLDLTVE